MRALRIVVPVLGEGLALAGRLRALRALRDRGAELVVVDGGSTDETWAVACAHADQALAAPRGRASQMNAGARAPGRFDRLLFLHSDTQLPVDADWLIDTALAAGRLWGRFDVRIDGPHPMLRTIERMMNLRSRLTGMATGDQAMFMTRDVFERLGGFAELPLMEDLELSRRLRRIGAPSCIRAPVRTSARRWEQHGVWRTIALMWRLRAAWFFGAAPQALADRYGYSRRPDPAAAGVAILAKAPVPGLAKTRLIPALGARGAARLQRQFSLRTLQTVRASGLGPITVWCAPNSGHRSFRALAGKHSVHCATQPEGDLGVRMQHACEQHFAQHPGLPLLLVGTDCAVLAPGHLQAAARALLQHDAVLVPAQDGGYVLIGLRRLLPQVFEGIAWSTPQVLAQTRDRLRSAGASWTELEPLWDVDEAPDWLRLQRLRAKIETSEEPT